MRCVVINMKEAKERRATITARFQEVGLPFEFFDAVGPGDLDEETWRFVDREGRERLGIYRLDDGSVCCLLSHLEVLFELVESGDDMVAVFEDDAILHPDLPAILAALEGKADRFDVVKLQRRQSSRPYFPVYSLTDVHTLGRVKYHDRGADGYVITRSAAAHLRERFPLPIHEIDWIIPKFWDSGLRHVYYLDPPVVFHDDDGPSQIRNSRDEALARNRAELRSNPLVLTRRVTAFTAHCIRRWWAFRNLRREDRHANRHGF